MVNRPSQPPAIINNRLLAIKHWPFSPSFAHPFREASRDEDEEFLIAGTGYPYGGVAQHRDGHGHDGTDQGRFRLILLTTPRLPTYNGIYIQRNRKEMARTLDG